MIEEHRVSRRASLKSMGTMGAAVVVGGRGSALQSEPKPAGSDQGKKMLNVVDVALTRFGKGHS